MAKRMIRIEPPYLLSIVVAVGVWVASTWSPLYRGGEPQISWAQTALHLGYLIPFFPDFKWISEVYWSLAVEFQFYIALGLLYPLLISRKRVVRVSTCLLFAALSWALPIPRFLPQLTPVFTVGIIAMLYKVRIASRIELAGVTAACMMVAQRYLGIEIVLVTLATVVCILWIGRMPPVILFLGEISFSFYLLHDMIGRRVIHVGEHLIPTRYDSVLPPMAMLVSLVAAFFMYRFAEVPAKRLAAKIKYRNNSAPLPVATATA